MGPIADSVFPSRPEPTVDESTTPDPETDVEVGLLGDEVGFAAWSAAWAWASVGATKLGVTCSQ